MPLALLLVSLSLLQACIAPAVSDYVSPFPDTTSSLASPNLTSDSCTDLRNCRSLVSIITSCLATIFACVWVAVHPNVPGPKQSWISKQIESAKVVVVTLLVPEWILAWAVRQFLQARYFRDRLETAAERAIEDDQNITHEGNTSRGSSSDQERDQALGIGMEEMSTPHDKSSKDSTGSVGEVTTDELDNERVNLVLHESHESNMSGSPKPASKLVDLWQLESELGRTDQSWTITHGFLMTMGGFHFYRGGEAMFPLDFINVLDLVESRLLVPPTLDELGDRSKRDALSKTIAILQTLWFVAQCIARRVENLAITNLEIMTLAYTVITVAMYAAWWHKPLNMRCPVRVKGDEEVDRYTEPFQWNNIIDYVTGDQDVLTHLRHEERVPTFWSSCRSDGDLPLYADIIALSVAMVFGAVHCAAWLYVFPSLEQKWMWRVCALAIAAIPLPMAVAFAVFNPFRGVFDVAGIIMAIGALLYILARMFLLVLSLTTLHNLPPSAYQTVQWTTWIPHI